MYTKTIENGRLCNQIIRNLCVSIIARKFNLYVEYSQYSKINSLGINLYIGSNKFNSIIDLNDNNFFNILNQKTLLTNLDIKYSFFQTKEISNFLYNYLHSSEIKNNIITQNPFNERYNNNNDCFVHIRLGDASEHSPKYEYFINAINQINYDKLYIATDDINHEIIKDIKNEKQSILINLNEVETIQFGSTCKHIILSQGTYSAMIGYLGFDSTIYYMQPDVKHIWHGNIFEIDSKNWIKINN
jgi:hypothetical protein